MCWAASVASVGQYKTGISKTAKQVANAMSIGYNSGGGAYDITSALSSIYSLSPYLAEGIFNSGTVADILLSGGAIIALFSTYDLNYSHAVAINSYRANSHGCYYTVMDPNYSSYVMVSAGVDADGFNTYTLYYSGYGTFYWYASVVCF